MEPNGPGADPICILCGSTTIPGHAKLCGNVASIALFGPSTSLLFFAPEGDAECEYPVFEQSQRMEARWCERCRTLHVAARGWVGTE